MLCSCYVYNCKDIREANDSALNYEWMIASYPDCEVYELEQFIYLIVDTEGELWYVKCMSTVSMEPTLEQWIRKKQITKK